MSFRRVGYANLNSRFSSCDILKRKISPLKTLALKFGDSSYERIPLSKIAITESTSIHDCLIQITKSKEMNDNKRSECSAAFHKLLTIKCNNSQLPKDEMHPILMFLVSVSELHALKFGGDVDAKELDLLRRSFSEYMTKEGSNLLKNYSKDMSANELYLTHCLLEHMKHIMTWEKSGVIPAIAALKEIRKAERTVRHGGRKTGDTQYKEQSPY